MPLTGLLFNYFHDSDSGPDPVVIVLRSHDAHEVVRVQGSRAALGGPYGTLGHANAAELVKFDRGRLSHQGVDAFDKAAYERTKHIVADQDRASSSARVSIGEGLHGLGGSRGMQN